MQGIVGQAGAIYNMIAQSQKPAGVAAACLPAIGPHQYFLAGQCAADPDVYV